MADLVKVSTPIGKLMWINATGQGKLNYNEDGHEYVASIILGLDSFHALKDKITELYDSEHQKGKKLKSLGYKPCDEDGKAKDKGGNEITAEKAKYFVFNFKTSTTFKDGTTKKINFYNSKPQKIDLGDTRVGNGSLGAISGSMRYYINGKEDGVSLWLNAIQITSFIEYTEDAGFDEHEGGFEGIKDEDTGFEGQAVNTEPTVYTAPVTAKTAKPRL